MGDETWFRGSGKGVDTAKTGAHLHNLGDGMYLADTEDVAWQYARIRSGGQHQNYEVWQVTVDRMSLGRVLDLTTDSRWHKFMTEPMLPGSKNPNLSKPRIYYMRRQDELYGQFFEEFLRKHKIEIKDYDAVIGHEYVRGGKQLCILHKNGVPTSLQSRIRALLRPERWAARLAKVVGQRSQSVASAPVLKTVSYPRIIGGVIVVIGIQLLISYLAAKAMQAINDSIIKKRMMEIEPEVQRYAAARKIMMLDSLIAGKRAFVTATVRIEYLNVPNTASTQSVEYFQSPARVNLDSLGITERDWSAAPKHLPPEASIFGGGTWTDPYELTFSVEAEMSAEEVAWYQDIRSQTKWAEETIKDDSLVDADKQRLRLEVNSLYEQVSKTYPMEFNPVKKLWTKDGYSENHGNLMT